ncbi:MAG: GntR family transcriptional regulator [Pseudomonadota bacterium]
MSLTGEVEGTTRGKLPLYVQLSERLVREIQAGLLRDGERLAPERDMAVALGVSVGTLRKALADLEAKGMLQRIQGSGNYIRNQAQVDSIYAFFRLETLAGGGLPGAEILSMALASPPPGAPHIGHGDKAVRIRRLRQLDEQDAAVEEIYLDAEYWGQLAGAEVSESLYHFYRETLGLVIAEADDFVSAAEPPAWTPQALRSHSPATWGFVRRTSRDPAGRTVEYSETWFDPSRVTYAARWR